LSDHLEFDKLGINPQKDVLTIMATQAGMRGIHESSYDVESKDRNKNKTAISRNKLKRRIKGPIIGKEEELNIVMNELPENIDPISFAKRLGIEFDGYVIGKISHPLNPHETALIPLSPIKLPENPIKLVYFFGHFNQVYKTVIFESKDQFIFQGLLSVYEKNKLLNQTIIGDAFPGQVVVIPLEPYSFIKPFFNRYISGEPTGNIFIKKTLISHKNLNEELSDEDYENLINILIPIKYLIRHQVDLVNISSSNEEVIIFYENRDDYKFQSIKYGDKEIKIEENKKQLDNIRKKHRIFEDLLIEEEKVLVSMETTEDYKLFHVFCSAKSKTTVEFFRSFIRYDILPINEQLIDYENIRGIIKNLPPIYFNKVEEILNLIGDIRKARLKNKTDKVIELKNQFKKERLVLVDIVNKSNL